MARTGRWLAALVASVTLFGCGGGGGSGSSGLAGSSGGGSSVAAPASGTSTLTVRLTDGPACGFDAVNVTIARVRFHMSATAAPNDQGWIDLDFAPRPRVNLLDYVNGNERTLGAVNVPVGTYQQTLLVVQPSTSGSFANSVVPTGVAEQPLATPASIQSGVRIATAFDASASTSAIVLDFDACRSVVKLADNSYLLDPVVRLVSAADAGSVTGNVDPTTAVTGATVSIQRAGTVVRSTIVDQTTGAFTLSSVPAGLALYDVVILGRNRTPVVITGVPVIAARETRVTPQGGALTPPLSIATQTVSGTILPTSIFPRARALQPLDTTTIEVAFARGNDAGAYSLTVPLGVPLVAAYPLDASLTLTPNSFAPGVVTVEAAASGYLPRTAQADVRSGAVLLDLVLPPAP